MVRWCKEEESQVISKSVSNPLDSTTFMQELTRLYIPLSCNK